MSSNRAHKLYKFVEARCRVWVQSVSAKLRTYIINRSVSVIGKIAIHHVVLIELSLISNGHDALIVLNFSVL